jgi:hypothetical protein
MTRITTAAALKITAVLAAPGLLLIAGCNGSTGSTAAPAASSAHAAVSSAMANPAVSADAAQLENELLANLKGHYDPAHPVKSVEAAVQATFPQGDTHKIEAYAVKTFTPGVLTSGGPGSARSTWAQGVVTFALAQGASPSASVTP